MCSFLIHDKDTLFTSAQRSYMVYELLLRTRYSDDNKEKLGKNPYAIIYL